MVLGRFAMVKNIKLALNNRKKKKKKSQPAAVLQNGICDELYRKLFYSFSINVHK